MENIHFLEIITKVFSLIGTENAQGKVKQCPEMDGFPGMAVDFRHIMNLSMAVMAGCDAIRCLGCQNLVGFSLAVGPSLFRVTGLEETATATAAEVIGFIRGHVDEIFFTHNRLNHISHVFGNRISQGLSDQLAGILKRKLDLTFFVPV